MFITSLGSRTRFWVVRASPQLLGSDIALIWIPPHSLRFRPSPEVLSPFRPNLHLSHFPSVDPCERTEASEADLVVCEVHTFNFLSSTLSSSESGAESEPPS
jgi:hypothetical protein